MASQAIIDIAEICAQKGVRDVVVSPGSRSAPLTLAYARHPLLKTWIFPDERSAAYIACGIAASTHNPVAVTTTSGTAALNLTPAVAEAFFQQIPLIVITADRPPEWIDQHDNQAVRQTGIFGRHVKESYTLPVSFEHPDEHWHAQRIVSEAINLACRHPQGPVHINVPLREPLYSGSGNFGSYSQVKIIESEPVDAAIANWSALKKEWSSASRILIVAGQYGFSPILNSQLKKIIEKNIPVSGDILSNLHGIAPITHFDLFINRDGSESLQPDLLITFGKNILSKNLKLFLRKNKPVVHWHLQRGGGGPDTFQSATRLIDLRPEEFFGQLLQNCPVDGDAGYHTQWLTRESKIKQSLAEFIDTADFGEFKAVYKLLKNLPENCHLHLANSMPVRYGSLTGLTTAQEGVRVFSSRGTSGIDGCNSAAVGDALVSGKLVVLITGDLAFFYDRNAFWHNYPIDNLRILLLNNHGGGIFRLIDGPSGLPELKEYFETQQNLNAKNTAADFGFDYWKVSDEKSYDEALSAFFSPGEKAKLLEVDTTSEQSKEIFDHFKNLTKKFNEA